MRSPKALFFSIILLFTGGYSQAQFQLFAGPQVTSAKYLILNNQQPTEFKQSFMAGVGLTTPIEGPLYFFGSLYYSQKGYDVTFNRRTFPPDTAAKNNNTTLHTIAFAPLLQLNLSKAANHFFVRFGPGFDFAVSGREAFDSTGGKRVNRQMTFGSVGYSPATAFGNVHLGYERQGSFSVFLNYEHGLSNLNNADLGPMILHRVAGVSIGWKFGKRKNS